MDAVCGNDLQCPVRGHRRRQESARARCGGDRGLATVSRDRRVRRGVLPPRATGAAAHVIGVRSATVSGPSPLPPRASPLAKEGGPLMAEENDAACGAVRARGGVEALDSLMRWIIINYIEGAPVDGHGCWTYQISWRKHTHERARPPFVALHPVIRAIRDEQVAIETDNDAGTIDARHRRPDERTSCLVVLENAEVTYAGD